MLVAHGCLMLRMLKESVTIIIVVALINTPETVE